MDNLKEWIEEVLNDNGCHLYELEWITNQGTPLLRVSVEKEDGTIDLDTCATCSDAIGTMLDEKALPVQKFDFTGTGICIVMGAEDTG